MRQRIRAMQAIHRIRDHELQAKSSDLTRMQGDLVRIIDIRKQLQDARMEACQVETPQAMAYATRYLRAVNVEENKAREAAERMEGMIAVKREEVMTAWRDVRSIDRLRLAAVTEVTRRETAAETAGNDERNLIAYGRAQRLAG